MSHQNDAIEYYETQISTYEDLNKLYNEVLKQYEIDISENIELNELARKIDYKNHMNKSQRPNIYFVEHYTIILMIVILTFSLASQFLDKFKNNLKSTQQEV